MFYPMDSLKRGGRFYLCWVADSWPLRFATITQRQLWSQDIRQICDDILEVVTNESGRPTKRFSLRLSSQLMRGLVRLYQRKTSLILSELCVLNANVMKNVNKKLHQPVTTEQDDHESIVRPRSRQTSDTRQVLLHEEQETAQTVEEMIQNSRNVVAHIDDITLRESTMPEQQVPVTDGFGEEHPEQALQLAADRTLEVMLHADSNVIQQSVLELPLDVTAKSQDRSRQARELLMERVSEHDITMFGKEISGIPDLPIPDLPVPQMTKFVTEGQELQPATMQPTTSGKKPPSLEIELDELDETENQPKRRRRTNRLKIDKNPKIPKYDFLERMKTNTVFLRCERGLDESVEIYVPCDVHFRRPCHAGHKITNVINSKLTRLFQRNLGPVNKRALTERDIETPMARSQQPVQTERRTQADRIEEVDEQIQEIATELSKLHPGRVTEADSMFVNGTLQARTSATERVDISDLMTQLVVTTSQRERQQQSPKRVRQPDESDTKLQAKRQRTAGYVSFRESQSKSIDDVGRRSIRAMLQDAGIADTKLHEEQPMPVIEKSRRERTGSSETPLGSLDRTKVSLGSSELTTDSQRFIRENWGTEGTITKILKCIKTGETPVTVESLLAKGPVLPGHTRVTAARCFASILKLKQHKFIEIIKHEGSLEIADITVSSKFNELLDK